MFLSELSPGEKEAFISLSVYTANINGLLDTETDLIGEYCREMSIEHFRPEDALPLEKITGIFAESSPHIKKVVLLETLGLVYADGVYDSEEMDLVDRFAADIGLAGEDVVQISEVFIKYMDVLTEITDLIM